MESFALLSISGAPVPSGAQTSSPEPPCVPELPGPAPAEPPGSELPARTCIVYRPWFSPYSYFVCATGATRSPVGAVEGPDEPDDLSEVVCSSACSLEEPRAAEGARPPRAADGAWGSVTVQDIVAASRWQLAPQDGYKCVACCRIFPTLCSLKSHLRYGAREGFSCRVFYRKLKALWQRERAAQEAQEVQDVQPL